MNTMFRPIILYFFFCVLCAGDASAQNLYLKSPRYYQYSGDSLPDKIYLFPNDDKEVEVLVEKISNIAGIKRPDSFLLSANVTDVVALVYEGKRHILYNAFYFIKTKDESLRVALLAHAIGLHANQSQFPLQKVPRWEEELKADEFMGYALYFMGVQQNAALSVPERLPLGFPVDIDDRRTAILMGWKRANSKAVFTDGKNFSEEEKAKMNADGIREFPCCPPPQYSNLKLISDCFVKCKTLGEVRKNLTEALETCGYSSQRVFRIKEGFALVTQLEQYNRDGSCIDDLNVRWAFRSPQEKTFSALTYLKSLVSSEPGHFRVFVFLATPCPVGRKNESKPTYQEAMNWLEDGAVGDLPQSIKNQKFIPGKTNVTALVYEYEVPKSTRKADLTKPGLLQPEVHLSKSGIIVCDNKKPCNCKLSQKK